MTEEQKAKIFLSCGQRDNELETVRLVVKALEKMGFDVFVAVDRLANQPLVPKIIEQIKESDYFIFIDFIRVNSEHENDLPFSIYSHQELAIARLIELPMLTFREKGLVNGVGMSSNWADNPTVFENREGLADLISEQVEKEHWTPEHQNRLIIGDPIGPLFISGQPFPKHFDKYTPTGKSVWGDAFFFHIPVYNGSYYRDATNCMTYVYRVNGESLQAIDKYDKKLYETIAGLKWTGTLERGIRLRKVMIVKGKALKLKAFLIPIYIMKDDPSSGFILTIGDNGQYGTRFFESPNTYELEYAIVSDNFEPATIQLRITLGETIDAFTVEKI